MPKIEYTSWNPRGETLTIVQTAVRIAEEYAREGYELTLRQAYYQFVARDILENTQQNYKRLGEIINRARLAGLLDWNHITDRTRSAEVHTYNPSPEKALADAEYLLSVDPWKDQEYYVEVWVEKDALSDVVAKACGPYRVNYFACRGYVSQSEMWAAANRLRKGAQYRKVKLIHLGDHDPSGLDMSRDIEDRLSLFMGRAYLSVDFERIALNFDQIEEYSPPPNPAKTTDSRFDKYQSEYGEESWELDALDPRTLDDLISAKIRSCITDTKAWEEARQEELDERANIRNISSNYHRVVKFLEQDQP